MRRAFGFPEFCLLSFTVVLTLFLEHDFQDAFQIVKNRLTLHLYRQQLQTSVSFSSSLWTNGPICFEDTPDSPCIYTSTTYDNHTGIVIFTTPDLAASIAPLLHRHSPPPQNPPPFALASIPSKGIGLLAITSIPPSTCLLLAQPIALIHPSPHLTPQLLESHLHHALTLLPSTTATSFLNLSHFTHPPYTPYPIQSTLAHNAFDIHLQGTQHLFISPLPSRLNHACNPNTQYHISSTTLTFALTSTRPLPPGSELTISYISPLQPTASRQRMLQSTYGFTCTCPRCTNGDESDAILEEIITLQTYLSSCAGSGAHQGPYRYVDVDMQSGLGEGGCARAEVRDKAERLVRLYEEEGLDGFVDVAYGYIVDAAAAGGDGVLARRYVKLIVDVLMISRGRESEEVRRWQAVVEELGE